jgi:type IV pilus assembly protein PilW
MRYEKHMTMPSAKAFIRQTAHGRGGFTLVELLTALCVGLVVLAAFDAVYVIQNREFNRQEQIAEMQQNARMAMDLMSREIMMAGYGPDTLARCKGTAMAANQPCVGITAANPNAISFTVDLDGDGSTQHPTHDPNENITYDLYASKGIQTLGRASNYGSRQPVVENISVLAFAYLDSEGAETSDLAKISTVQIALTAQTAKKDPNSGSHRQYLLTSRVNIRNAGKAGF